MHQSSGSPDGRTISRRSFVKTGSLLAPAALWGAASGSESAFAAPAVDDAETTDQVPAFPGAEGGGRYATGGRGGELYEVTNLNDSGAGSLRDAVSGDNRTIVFRVSGNIEIAGGLDITGSNLTIAGQTAPGDGICVLGNETQIQGNNVILRYLRFRGGDILGTPIDTFGAEGVENVIIDHCSFSWGVDECFSVYGNRNVTVQWCIIAEGLAMSAHEKGRHGYGGLWGGDNITYHHNLLIHQGGRNPRFSFVEDHKQLVDHRNNVIYNYGFTSGYGGEWAEGVNVADNYYKPGPDTLADVAPVIFNPGRFGNWYIDGNVIEGHPDVTEDNSLGLDLEVGGINLLADPVALPDPIPAQSAQAAYRDVLDKAGAILPRRDATDARLINDVRNGTGRMINSQNEVGGWPPLQSKPAPRDQDHDGIPDDWERTHGLKPTDPSDANELASDGSGYTNLEVYLNSIGRTGKENPTVAITSPSTNAVFSTEGGSNDITITADTAAAAGASIATVEFYASDQKVGESTAAPYAFNWIGVTDGTHYLTARATDSLGTATISTCVPIHVNHTSAVTPWRSKDIGAVPIPGSAALANGTFTIKGSGKIKGRSDSFHYVYQPISAPGDEVVEIVARVDELSRVYEGVTAGVMIRESLTPDSPFVLFGMAWHESGLIANGVRISRFGTQVSESPYPWEGEDELDIQPYWLRLTKRGSEFSGELSSDSLQWTRVVYERIDMADNIYVGLAVDGNKEANGIANYTTAKISQVRINA